MAPEFFALRGLSQRVNIRKEAFALNALTTYRVDLSLLQHVDICDRAFVSKTGAIYIRTLMNAMVFPVTISWFFHSFPQPSDYILCDMS